MIFEISFAQAPQWSQDGSQMIRMALGNTSGCFGIHPESLVWFGQIFSDIHGSLLLLENTPSFNGYINMHDIICFITFSGVSNDFNSSLNRCVHRIWWPQSTTTTTTSTSTVTTTTTTSTITTTVPWQRCAMGKFLDLMIKSRDSMGY